MNKRLQVILVLLFFALMAAYIGAYTYVTFSRLSLVTPQVRGWSASPQNGRMVISTINAERVAGDLRVGDKIVALGGETITNSRQIVDFFLRVPHGSSYTITVEREGQPQEEITLQTIRPPFSWWASQLMANLFAPSIFLLTGLAVFLLKPFDKHARLLALLLGRIVPAPVGAVLTSLPWWLNTVIISGISVSVAVFPVALHFFLVFPQPAPILRRHPRLERYIYLPGLLIALPHYLSYGILFATGSDKAYSSVFPLLNIIATVLAVLYVSSSLVLLVRNYRRSKQADRYRLRVLIVGMIVGSVPWMSFMLLSVIDRSVSLGFSNLTWNWLHAFTFFILSVMPLSFAYAIVRHKVIPVHLIIRRGVQYLFAKNALRLLLILPLAGILLTILLNPNRTLAEILFRNSIYFYVLVIAALLLGLIFRKRLTEWIDRKFFRESYNQEKILRELVEDVKRADSMAEMSKLVSAKVDSALHPEHIHLFYREEDRRDLSLGYSLGTTSSDLRIPAEFRLLRFMEDQGGALDFPFPQKNNLPQEEKDWLARLGTRLVVPMTGADGRLAGLFLLGEKKAEIPYTARDRELLETLADQIAIVHENIHLKERAHRERKIKREVLARFEEQNINLLKECPACGACYDSSIELCAKDKSELTLSLPVERTIEARYRLDQLIGKGGMGAVYEAKDLRLDRPIAIKILSGNMFGDRAALRRFEREAQASARLNHPNIVRVYDYGALHTEGAFLVMEMVRGETLRQMLKRDGRISMEAAAALFDQVLDAVRAAHDARVIHRDLKPENILLSKAENERKIARVLDFGLAKIVQQNVSDTNSPTAPVTSPGTVMGTFGYMSPEQLMGTAVDERSDLFSIGVMVVEAITGKRPFSGKTHHELLINILQEPFHLQSDGVEAERLGRILQKCLMKEPAARFSSAADLQRELIPALRACPPLASLTHTAREADTFIFKK